MVSKLMAGCGINNRKLHVFTDITRRTASLTGRDGGIKPKLVAGCGIENSFVEASLYDSIILALCFKLNKTAEYKAQN